LPPQSAFKIFTSHLHDILNIKQHASAVVDKMVRV